ncbi:MAG TPA: class I SAM-dependent methyltransferase [Acidimicrobiales bacterium]|nr:class I SAM-dependent methyltransferase [Acidimicrobiales bacterium]
MPGEWDDETENWLRWARTPGFDAYWYYRDAFFDSLLPTPRGRTLEIGCGEGRVARDLGEREHQVTALDSAGALVQHARDADTQGLYLVGEGARLPVRDRSFDLVVAYNALQVVDDMAQTVVESARVLRPGGHLCFCVAHPVTDMGQWIHAHETSSLALRVPYFESTRVEDTVEKDGLRMTFRGWTYTLEDYAVALEDAGFAIEAIREPKPVGDDRYQQWGDLPLFMNVRAVRR